MPLLPQLVDPVQKQLMQLIMSDGFDHDEAHNLAEKIIEYERNILYLMDIFKDELIVLNDANDMRGAAIFQKKEEKEDLVNTLTDIEQLEREVMNQETLHVQDRELLQALKHAQKACKTFIRSKKKIEVNRIVNSQRYFKRASNQLIKALKRL